MNWCVYLVLCSDGSLYCGITNQLATRFMKHQNGKGARYTKMRGAVEMRVIACCLTKGGFAWRMCCESNEVTTKALLMECWATYLIF